MNLCNWILRAAQNDVGGYSWVSPSLPMVAQNDDEEIAADCRDSSLPMVVRNDGSGCAFFDYSLPTCVHNNRKEGGFRLLLQSLVRVSHNYLASSVSASCASSIS